MDAAPSSLQNWGLLVTTDLTKLYRELEETYVYRLIRLLTKVNYIYIVCVLMNDRGAQQSGDDDNDDLEERTDTGKLTFRVNVGGLLGEVDSGTVPADGALNDLFAFDGLVNQVALRVAVLEDTVREIGKSLDIKGRLLLEGDNVEAFNKLRVRNRNWKPNFHGIVLEGKRLNGVNLHECDLSNANLRGTSMIGAVMMQANLGGANMEGASVSNAQMSGVNLGQANLKCANLVQTNLCHANLTAADLSGANLTKVDFRSATLVWAIMDDKTNMTGALLEGTDMLGIIGLNAAQLAKTACFHLAKSLDSKVLVAALEVLIEAAKPIISAQR